MLFISLSIPSVFWIRIGLNTDPDPEPASEVNKDPGSAEKVNTDPDPDPGFVMTNIFITNRYLDLHKGLSDSNQIMQLIINTVKDLLNRNFFYFFYF